MKRGLAQGLKGLFGVVALVEDEGDVLAALSQLAVAFGQFFRDGLKGRGPLPITIDSGTIHLVPTSTSHRFRAKNPGSDFAEMHPRVPD